MILPVSAGKVKRTLCKGCTAQQSNPCPPPRRGESKPEGADTMTAFDKKVNQIAARHRWNIEKQARAAVPCYIIAAPTYEDTGKIVAVLNRCKGLYHETLTPIHYESWAVKVYDAGQIAAYRERERQKAALVDAFYMALKANGGDQNAAKAAQREKAVQWNAVEVFNEIYA
ncbi:MAG: hypothetical protein [Bacteriophage sp.]|jgi:hypothetical protein|nr:MAG: hypothetical protein [Bacteriophage sp.]UWD57683.1 MAG: hypothetical protein [Bacteriophage sp.]UWG29024.1 MAG: hypothetical protein [Bacteriophage sp.]